MVASLGSLDPTLYWLSLYSCGMCSLNTAYTSSISVLSHTNWGLLLTSCGSLMQTWQKVPILQLSVCVIFEAIKCRQAGLPKSRDPMLALAFVYACEENTWSCVRVERIHSLSTQTFFAVQWAGVNLLPCHKCLNMSHAFRSKEVADADICCSGSSRHQAQS